MIKLRILPHGPDFENPDGLDLITIGRGDEMIFKLEDPHVSALHGQLLRKQANWYYQDMGSTNGSAVEKPSGRVPLTSTDAPVKLESGDHILVGSHEDPVVIEVVSCESKNSNNATATVLAETRIADSSQLANRLQATGMPLGPFISLSEKLSRVKKINEAFSLVSHFLGSTLDTIELIAIVQPHANTTPVLLWQSNDYAPIDLPIINDSISSDSVSEVQVSQDGLKALLSPLRTAPGRIFFSVAKITAAKASEADKDALSLVSLMLAQRMAQIETIEKLHAARSQLIAQNQYLRKKADERAGGEIIGEGPAISSLLKKISAVSVSDATVLITGQSGSGKELVAREIHRRSLRHSEIFATLNCGALAEGVLESELFGHVKGAFTGAHKGRTGIFEVAHGGTLFLDEVGEMSPGLQVKLLRVLETGEVTPVGSTRKRKVDVRLLFATNRNLEQRVQQGAFRQDLFFRINVFPINVPCLAERKEDIPALTRHFLSIYAKHTGAGATEISTEALQVLSSLEWPGNVRQLANEIRRAMIMAAPDGIILPRHLSRTADQIKATEKNIAQGTLKEQLSRVERQLVCNCLEQFDGNRTKAARALGITRQALLAKLKKLHIQ